MNPREPPPAAPRSRAALSARGGNVLAKRELDWLISAARTGCNAAGHRNTDWRAACRMLREAGFEVSQHDGAVFVDGVLSRDPALYPPELAVPGMP